MSDLDTEQIAEEAVNDAHKNFSTEDKEAYEKMSDGEKADYDKKISDAAIAKAKESADKGESGDKTVPKAALDEERNKRKKLEKRLDDIEREQKKSKEADMKKRGEHEKLIDAKDQEISQKDEVLAKLRGEIDEFHRVAEESVEEALKSIKKTEDREFIKEMLEGKSPAEKQKALPKLLARFGKPGSINASADGKNAPIGDKDVQIQDLKKKIDEAKKEKNPTEVMRLKNKLTALIENQ